MLFVLSFLINRRLKHVNQVTLFYFELIFEYLIYNILYLDHNIEATKNMLKASAEHNMTAFPRKAHCTGPFKTAIWPVGRNIAVYCSFILEGAARRRITTISASLGSCLPGLTKLKNSAAPKPPQLSHLPKINLIPRHSPNRFARPSRNISTSLVASKIILSENNFQCT